MLRNTINDLIKEVCKKISSDFADMSNYEKLEFREILLNAYNRYQEYERDGVDYIFDVRDKKDVACCNDMTFKEWYELANDYIMEVNETPYFFFGANYKKAEPINTEHELVGQIFSTLEDIVRCVICRPNCCDSYRLIYDKYIGDLCYE